MKVYLAPGQADKVVVFNHNSEIIAEGKEVTVNLDPHQLYLVYLGDKRLYVTLDPPGSLQ